MKKKKQYEREPRYLCPHCGNDAPDFMKEGKPWYCHYCKQAYYKDERIRQK